MKKTVLKEYFVVVVVFKGAAQAPPLSVTLQIIEKTPIEI